MNGFIHCAQRALKTGSVRQFRKGFQNLPAVSIVTGIHEVPHVFRHHVVDSAVSKGTWFPGNVLQVRQPVHALRFIFTVQPSVADNLMQVLVHDNDFRRSQPVLDNLFTESRGSGIAVFAVIQHESSVLVCIGTAITGSIEPDSGKRQQRRLVFQEQIGNHPSLVVVFTLHILIAVMKQFGILFGKPHELRNRNQQIAAKITDLVFHIPFFPA